MIDFHNHVIPQMDDGAKDLETSLNMLNHAAEQGITDVVNTVHYQHPKMINKKINFEKVKGEINKLQNQLNKNQIPIKLHFGAEVFYLPNLNEIIDDPLTTFGDGKYMLIEFSTIALPKKYKETLFKLKMSGVTPIIAHPERYRQIQNDISIITDLLEAGCIMQIDAGSPLGLFGKDAKRTSIEILKNNWCQLLGSDAHNDKNRNFCLRQSIDFIDSLVDYNIKSLVNENPLKILNGDLLTFDIEYDTPSKNLSFLSRLKRKINIT
tara:strand:+ start:6029 stop:6826 length:798 start_codon:yes stop_codon:yes gene_type:complete